MASQDDFFAIDLDEGDRREEPRSGLDPGPPSPGKAAAAREEPLLDLDETVFEGSTGTEAEYRVDSKIRCPSCRKMIASVLVVRLTRARVSFISTLPRRGYVTVCPSCRAVLPADLGGLIL